MAHNQSKVKKVPATYSKRVSITEKKLISLSEGILGQYVFWSRCNTHSVINEYSFYESFHRIIYSHLEISSSIHVEAVANKHRGKGSLGDFKRFDFVISQNGNARVAIELKFFGRKRRAISKNLIAKDIQKLVDFSNQPGNSKVKLYIMCVYKGSNNFSPFEMYNPKRAIMHCCNATYYTDLINITNRV